MEDERCSLQRLRSQGGTVAISSSVASASMGIITTASTTMIMAHLQIPVDLLYPKTLLALRCHLSLHGLADLHRLLALRCHLSLHGLADLHRLLALRCHLSLHGLADLHRLLALRCHLSLHGLADLRYLVDLR